MKKKLLTTAMLAALGGVGTAHAVNVNPDGLGQVLLFPYYTVQNGFVTSIHITNTTSQTKAVKVRFLEGKNSQEVLDFNLYLSPYDVWAARIIGDETGGARLQTVDTSCITPRALAANGEPFRNIGYTSDSAPNNSIERTREGYVEVIEMGYLDPTWGPGELAVHQDGVPYSCAQLRSAESQAGFASDWISAPTGGLFGSGHLISVNRGIRTSYDATAIDGFFAYPDAGDANQQNLWSSPGSLTPSLANATGFATVVDGTQLIPLMIETDDGDRVDRVSAVLMKSAIMNEYAIDAGREAKTDWVVTFPTKRFYVNPTRRAPFEEAWNRTTGKSCDTVTFEYWDREEASRVPSEGDFSPAPETPGFELCNEVNTLTLYRDGADADDSRVFGAQWTKADLSIENGFTAGWMKMSFLPQDGDPVGNKLLPMLALIDEVDAPVTFTGLPVIGFAAMSAVNQVSVEINGLVVYSAYMGSLNHKNELSYTFGIAQP